MINYSIIIPTYNRHNLMQKNIEYFSTFRNCQIYICDSTEDKYEGEFPINMTYVHMPQKSFVQKMSLILEDITTNYVAVCADDDFLIEDTVNEILVTLNDKGYVMGVGKYAGFDISFGGFFDIYTKQPKVDSNFSILRVISYLSNYYMSLWAVYKKDTIKKAYRVLEKSNFGNHNLIELTIAINCAIEGRIFFSEKLYGVREINNLHSKNWAKQHLPILSAYKNEYKRISTDINLIGNHFENAYLFKVGVYSYLFFALKLRFRKKNAKNNLIVVNNNDLKKIENLISKENMC